MGELRFDGRVAIVTGAGANPGLGRAYARLLAAHGARVVVNDLGVGPDGRGTLRAHADAVAEEIIAAGGEAVADTNSVSEEAGAKAVVQTALDTWGKVDIVINNAGVFHAATFRELSSSDLERIVQVHLFGNIWMCRAVWPLMQEQRYGRIVNISSIAALGVPYQVVYGAAKAGILGLSRGLAMEGREYGIHVNAVNPAAMTASVAHCFEELEITGVAASSFRPELVAPAVVYLAHEDCQVSGKFISSGAGHVSEYYFAETAGHDFDTEAPEEVRDSFASVIDHEGSTDVPDPGLSATGAAAEGSVFTPKPYDPNVPSVTS